MNPHAAPVKACVADGGPSREDRRPAPCGRPRRARRRSRNCSPNPVASEGSPIFDPSCVQVVSERGERPRRPGAGQDTLSRASVVGPADQRGVSLPGQRDAPAELALGAQPRAGELRSLLSPRLAGPGEHPRRPGTEIVLRPAGQRGVPVARQRDARAESGRGDASRAGQLRPLLRPRLPRARERPRRAAAAIEGTADQGGGSIGGQRDGVAELVRSGLARAGQLRPLLSPRLPRAGEHPRRPGIAVVGRPADQRPVPIRRQRDAMAELGRAGRVPRRSASALAGSRSRPRRRRPTPRRRCRCRPAPPTSAVVPSADSATLWPNLPAPLPPEPVSLGPSSAHRSSPSGRPATPPRHRVVVRPADQRHGPIGGHRDALAETGRAAGLARPADDSFESLLGPGLRRAGEHPRRAQTERCRRTRRPTRCSRRRTARRSSRSCWRWFPRAGQLRPCCGPGRARADEDPRRPAAVVVVLTADQRRVPVRRTARRRCRTAGAGLARAGQLRPLLGPGLPRAGEHPRRPDSADCRPVVGGPADQRRVPVRGQRDALAELACAGLARTGQLRTLLGPGLPRAGEHPRRPDVAVVAPARRPAPCSHPRTARRSSRRGRRRSLPSRSASILAASTSGPSA